MIRNWLPLLLVVILAGGTAPVGASGVQFGCQVKAGKTGTIAGEFSRDYQGVDLYIIAISNDVDTPRRLHALTFSGPETLTWQGEIRPLLSPDQIKRGGWGALPPVDFTPLGKEMDEIYLLILLVKQGEDPYDTENWVTWESAPIQTDAGERVPGQTDFIEADSRSVYNPAVPTVDDTEVKDEEGDPEVEKPDIFKIRDDRLYYANGSAGRFQVVDLSDPGNPALLTSISMEDTPRELYALDEHLLLVEQAGRRLDAALRITTYPLGEGDFKALGQLEIEDFLYETSRRSGNRIFLCGSDPLAPYRGAEGQEKVVCTLDISNPLAPVLLSRQTLAGYDLALYLDADYLIALSREHRDTTLLSLFDLKGEGDPLENPEVIEIAGRVPSEDHILARSDGNLFVIYRDRDMEKGSGLAVFDLKDSGGIRKKGVVTGIAPGEELYAATFEGDRAYLVTYERQDPLWVLDISDPSAPFVLGELEVPGWSERIRFHNQRLVALGYDDTGGGRLISMALFSVADPENPMLLDRVTPLSGETRYSYSEAVSDDRGFYFDSESGLIIVPVSWYEKGNQSGVEILKVAGDGGSFAWDHFVPADFAVKRGTPVSENRVISMGDAALNIIGLSPPAKPEILGSLCLAVNVESIAAWPGNETLFALGGDHHGPGTSLFMTFDPLDPGTPLTVGDSELVCPVLRAEGTLGALVSQGYFRLFDPETAVLGDIFKMETGDSPGYGGFFIRGEKLYIPQTIWDKETVRAKSTLLVYDCRNREKPEKTGRISIPGRPLSFTGSDALITVEQTTLYPLYRDYPAGQVRDEPGRKAEEAGTRINRLRITPDQAILEGTAFFPQEEGQWSETAGDEFFVYLILKTARETKITIIDPETLVGMFDFTLEGSWSPVRAEDRKLVLTRGYFRCCYLEAALPLPEGEETPEVRVYDLSGGVPLLLASKETHAGLGFENTAINQGVFYWAEGYRGIRSLSYHP